MTHRSVLGEFREFLREIIFNQQFIAIDSLDGDETVSGEPDKTYFTEPFSVENRYQLLSAEVEMRVAGLTKVKYGLYFNGKIVWKGEAEVEPNKNVILKFTRDAYPSGKFYFKANGEARIGIQGAGEMPVSGAVASTDTVLPDEIDVSGGHVRALIRLIKVSTAWPYREYDQKVIGVGQSNLDSVIVSAQSERMKPFGLGDAFDQGARILHELSASVEIRAKGEYNLEKSVSNILSQVNKHVDYTYTGRFGSIRFFDVRATNKNDESARYRNARKVVIDIVGKCYAPKGILI